MRISILTLFPEMFDGPFSLSIIKRAIEKNLVDITYVNIRDFAVDKHKSVDDRPFGGGQGMIIKVDVLDRAIEQTIKTSGVLREKTRIILTDPRGNVFTQQKAGELSSSFDHIILICAHYEGVDERILPYIDERISIGDYVLTGGEIPAMVIADSVIRLLPSVLKNSQSTKDESFTDPNMLEFPQFTRPVTYKGATVPKLIRSGDHKAIEEWKKKQSLAVTKKLRPDLLKKSSTH
jgi:tRNA (guanine37-N1)-methyltransferase